MKDGVMYGVQIGEFVHKSSDFDKCHQLGMKSGQEYKLFKIEITEIGQI